MKIESFLIKLDWPSEINVSNLRVYIEQNLSKLGIPLRWAITRIEQSPELNSSAITVEGVITY